MPELQVTQGRSKRSSRVLEPLPVNVLREVEIQEPSRKRVRSQSKVSNSLANLISPVRHLGKGLQHSMSFRGDSRPHQALLSSPSLGSPPGLRTASLARKRGSLLWSDMFGACPGSCLSAKEIRRQEAIFELSQGEQDLVDDLRLAKKAYHDPMLKLSIMTKEELAQIFGAAHSFIPLHEALLNKLAEVRKPDGSINEVGQLLLDWLPRLKNYKNYCSNQAEAKALLDHKKQDPRVDDFLRRCIESPFSRRLELWSFLDVPRGRLVKYPLLVQEILRHTPPEHPDWQLLHCALGVIRGVLTDLNRDAGRAECRFFCQRLIHAGVDGHEDVVGTSGVLHCHGELRNARGAKLHAFLFAEGLVLTRPVTRPEGLAYQVCGRPLRLVELDVVNVPDGEARLGGSFRGAFGDKAKNCFRVGQGCVAQQTPLTLQAADVFDKHKWLCALRQAKSCITATMAPAKCVRPPFLPLNKRSLVVSPA
uniref:rho guanine nucleotide exchange factor 3-like n=1 Tax=Myxine glutinosa TaxID=7769 RepID=UPI00358F4857